MITSLFLVLDIIYGPPSIDHDNSAFANSSTSPTPFLVQFSFSQLPYNYFVILFNQYAVLTF